MAILGELFIFLLVTNTVHRQRPPVPRLDPAPPTSSFPSGHTAAAMALYGCLAIVLLRQMTHRRLARVLAVLCFCVPPIVAVSRVYRGMHYPTDVLFGAIGGGLWLLIAVSSSSPPRRTGGALPGGDRPRPGRPRWSRRRRVHRSPMTYCWVGRESTGAASSDGVFGSASGGGGFSSTSSESCP